MKETRGFAGFVLAIALVCAGCDDPFGGEEQPCRSTGILGPYQCDDGLVCNESRATPTCEKPNINALGAPCTADRNCVEGLWCDRRACAKPLGEGESCPQGVGCAAGLACAKGGATPTCQKAAQP